MPTLVTDPPPPDAFAHAIESYAADAWSLFATAYNALHTGTPLTGQPLAEAQGRLSAGFAQLASSETMRSDQSGRVGYADVAALMHSVSTLAATVCTQLNGLAGVSPPDVVRINALNSILVALSQISPATVFQKTSSGS